jgi:hypothetical protein
LTAREGSRWRLNRHSEIGTMDEEAINPKAFPYFSRSTRL